MPPSLVQWRRIVDQVTLGEFRRRFITLCDTPGLLLQAGLVVGPLVISAAKLARCRREHPDVTTAIWHDLPVLLASPAAVFPSTRNDGSIVTALVVEDAMGNPVIVPIQPDAGAGHNAVLSVYGKDSGWAWVEAQLGQSAADGLFHFRKRGFAVSVPQPGENSPSSPGPIPADGTTKPTRNILTVRSAVKVPPRD
jgi:Phage MuF-C-terminal domain